MYDPHVQTVVQPNAARSSVIYVSCVSIHSNFDLSGRVYCWRAVFHCYVCDFAMTYLTEQRRCIKFCFKLGKTSVVTHKMLVKAFGNDALGQAQTYDWLKRIKTCRTSVGDYERSGRPPTRITPEIAH